jgi:acyl-coenzyme A thioesterase PaaI-like protein
VNDRDRLALDAPERTQPPQHILTEVGWNVRQLGDEMHGEGAVIAHLLAPGTAHLRTSMLAAWADHLMGLLVSRIVSPRVPATLELDIHLYRPAPGRGRIRGRSWLVKKGRSVLATAVEFRSDDDRCIAVGAGSFMLAGDPDLRLPARLGLDMVESQPCLTVPIAERASCERRAPGNVVLPRRADGLNGSNTINGGLLAMAAEEAVLSLCPGATLSSLTLRYLRPVRVGPAVATARLQEGHALVELSDAGDGERLAVTATARIFAPPSIQGGQRSTLPSGP